MKKPPRVYALFTAAIPAAHPKDSSTGTKNPMICAPDTSSFALQHGWAEKFHSNDMVILLNKPFRVLCQFTDSEGRATLADFVSQPDVYPAGRLDYDSEGLVVLTDEGGLQSRISHPRYGMTKTYWTQIEGIPDEDVLRRLCAGARSAAARRSGPAPVSLPNPKGCGHAIRRSATVHRCRRPGSKLR
jgi:16S rRNA U516 pseudouridylate synthase RsuA-like enzyme